MNSTKPRGNASPRRDQVAAPRTWIGIVGVTLCLGLWACGSGREESAGTDSPSTDPATPNSGAETSVAPVPNPDAGATSDIAPDPAFQNLPPVQAQARGTSEKAHLAMTGSQKFEGEAASNCALFPNKTFQIALNIPRAPFFVLQIENFHGAGEYDADARVRANFSGEVIRQSRGMAKATITVVKSAQPDGQDAISGSFSGSYQGDAGKGTVSGNFERCLYQLPEFNQ